MNFKKITILLLVLLVADQALKIWIKTHMTLDEAIMVVPRGSSCVSSRTTARRSACGSRRAEPSTGGNWR